MKRVVVAMLCALVAGQAHAATADQFDLVCSVSTDIYAVARDGSVVRSQSPPLSPFELRYSFDLSRKEWCPVNRCAIDGAQRIVDVTSTTIKLRDDPTDKVSVNRTDGTITMKSVTRSGIVTNMTGPCRKEAFTPLPTAQF